MLTEVTFDGFKSFENATLKLAPLTLLIGANASGKSNAIEGLRFLSWMAQDHKLGAIRYEVQGSDALVRGAVRDLPRRGERHFGFRWRRGAARYAEGSLELALDGEELRIVQERLRSGGRDLPLYEVKEPAAGASHDVKVAYDNFSRGGRKPLITCTDQQLVMLQLQSAARFAEGDTKAAKTIPEICRGHAADLAGTVFLDPAPRLMRGYSPIGAKEFRGDGSNLSGVVHTLCQDDSNGRRLLDFVKSLPEQDIARLEFITTEPPRDVMLRLVETFGGREQVIEAALLSDGTLRVLAIAAVLLSAPEERLVVIEEIDNGVHPSRAKSLLENIQSVAEQRRLQVLLTTHNPALMDALPDAALPSTVFCWRDPSTGASRLGRLGEFERSASLLAEGPLGRLVTRGVVDRFVKERLSAQERARAAEKWAENLFEPAAE
jgi:predicted ATPase